ARYYGGSDSCTAPVEHPRRSRDFPDDTFPTPLTPLTLPFPMVAALTCGGDAISVACTTGFTLAMQARRCQTGRIEFNRIDMLFWAGLFASGCSPPCLATAQLPSATQTFHVTSALGLSPVSFIVFVIAHSPAFQRWGGAWIGNKSRQGRKNRRREVSSQGAEISA